jgi:uncharacterized membrane protein YoaK (UPF0700 family)
MAIALAAAAGFVDAHVYGNVTPVFVANMSGNLVHLGIFVGDGRWATSMASLVTVGAFTGGVMLATLHHHRRVVRSQAVHPSTVLGLESVLLLVLMGWMAAVPIGFTAEPRSATTACRRRAERS